MCNLYEYEMTAEDMLKDHFHLIGTDYLDVLRGRNEATKVYLNYEAPVIRSIATPTGVVRDMVPMRWGFPAPPEEALQLQKPAPDDAIVVLPERKKLPDYGSLR